MGAVLELLIVCVAMDGSHAGFLDPEAGVDDCSDWCDTVSGARGVVEDGNGVFGVFFDKVLFGEANDASRDVATFSWGGDHDLSCASL